MQPNEWSGDVRSPGRSRRQCAAHWCSRGPRPEPPEEDGRGWPWMAMDGHGACRGNQNPGDQWGTWD